MTMTDERLAEIDALAKEMQTRADYGEADPFLAETVTELLAEVRRLRPLVADQGKEPAWLSQALNEGDGVYRP